MCEVFVTISQKLNKEKTERYWRKFVFTNNNSVKVAIIILQEPKYMDNQIEPALISAVNFVSKEYETVYVFNLLPNVMSNNVSAPNSVVDNNCSGSSSVDLIYGARAAKCFKDVNKNNELSEILLDTIKPLEKDKKIELKAFFDKDNGLAYTSHGKAVDSVKGYKTDELNSLLEQ